MIDYIHTLDGIIREMVASGETDAIIETMPIPEPYAYWLFSSFFYDNIRYLYQNRLEERMDGLI